MKKRLKPEMEMISLKLCLLLLWIFFARSQGQNAAEVEISVPYHNKMVNATYKGYVVRGQCVAPKTADSQLFLKIKASDNSQFGEYSLKDDTVTDIKKNRYLMVGKLHVRPGMPQVGLQFALCLKETLIVECSFQPPGRTAQATKTLEASPPPRTPVLSVDYHLKPRILINGQILRIGCAGVVGTRGKLIVKILANRQNKEIKWTIPYEGPMPSDVKVKTEESTLGPLVNALIEIPVTQSLANRWFICISSDFGGAVQLRDTQRKAKVKSFRHIPFLELAQTKFYGDMWTLDGTCYGGRETLKNVTLFARTADRTVMLYRTNRFTRKVIRNKDYVGPQRLLSAVMFSDYWRVPPKLRFTVSLTEHYEYVEFHCRLAELVRCRTYRAVSLVQDSRKTEAIKEGRERERYFVFITTVVLCVMGLVVGLLFAIMIDAIL